MTVLFATIALCAGLLLIARMIILRGLDREETEAERNLRNLMAADLQEREKENRPALTESEKRRGASTGAKMVNNVAGRISNSNAWQQDEGRALLRELDRLLTLAGMRDAYTPEQAVAFTIIIWLIGVIGPIMAYFVIGLAWYFAAPAMLFFILYPYLKLRSTIRARQDTIRMEIPFFIQQLHMALSTKMTTLDDAILRVARGEENSLTETICAREFAQAQTEYRLGGRNREEALRDVSRRTGVLAVENLVEAIIQGLRTGAQLDEVLIEYGKQAREMWRQDMRTYKNRKEPLITLGLVVTMFGALGLVATPQLFGIMQTLSGI